MHGKTRNFTRRIGQTRAAAGRHQADKIWQAMRMLRRFTVAELVAVVETSTASTVGSYASVLARTGFLRVQRFHRAPASYLLIRNSGPTPPSIVHRRTAVYDHNTETEYPLHANP